MSTKRFVVPSVAILCASLATAQVNRSFEDGPTGAAPPGWVVTGGTAIVSDTADCLFPSHGSKHVVVSSAGTGPVVAGYGPHAAGTCGQITQVVLRPNGAFASFEIDWEWLPSEALPSPFNDFMSIDLVNDVTNALITNVVFIDTGTNAGAPPYTNVPGAGAGLLTYVPDQSTVFGATGNQAPAGFKRAWVDLSTIPAGTPIRIEISVCNESDSVVDSRAYVDNVRLSGGDRNGTVDLRVLGSPHVDGQFSSVDWGGDVRAETPYYLRTCPGQRLALRATGPDGTAFAVAAGTLDNPGPDLGFGQLNLDLALPFTIVIDGFSPEPLTAWLGTLAAGGNFYGFNVPETVPFGTEITLQGLSTIPGFDFTAATTIAVGAPQIPIGGAALAGGANGDDGFTAMALAGFGAGTWPFYGVARADVFVGSNGYVTFVSGDNDFSETESEMLTDQPRIAALWDNINPAAGGDTRTTLTASTLTVSWTGVPEFVSSIDANNFSIQMYQAVNAVHPAGVFTIYYGSTTIDDGLAGISPGGLPAPGTAIMSTDLSPTSLSLGARGTIVPGTPRLERFASADDGQLRDKFDLMTLGGTPSRITFVPDGAGGYTYFTGTR
jgi:hypothetical protein